MRLLSGLVALGTTCVLGGCSSGDDVYIETTATRSGLCELSRGEDVCARSWSHVPVESRPEAVSWLQTIVTFSSEARTMLDELDAACTEMLGSLGVNAPVLEDHTTRAGSAVTNCQTASEAIRARRTTKLELVELEGPSCENVPGPSCVLPLPPPQRVCTPARVTLERAASPADAELATAITPAFGRVAMTMERTEQLVDLSARITSMTRSDVQLALPECLVVNATSLASEASAEAKVAVEIVGDLSAALER